MKLNTKPLGGIPLGVPVVEDGVYYALMTAEVKRNKANDNNNLVVNFKVIDPTVRLRESGVQIDNTNNINIKRYVAFPRDEDPESEERFNRQVKELAVAGGMEANSDEDVELDHLNQKIVKVKLGFEAGSGGFPDKNVSKYVNPLAEGEEPPAIPY